MSNSIYDNYFGADSNYKENKDINFDIGSFDANTLNDPINITIKSGKKEEENNSNKFNKNESKFEIKDKISEKDDQKSENNPKNILSSDNQISQKNEKDIEKEKEKEESPFPNKNIVTKSKRNSKTNNFIIPPNIERISDLKFDYQNYSLNNLTPRDKDYYEKEILERKAENEKLKIQYEEEFEKGKEALKNLNEQHKIELEKIRTNTEEKIKELVNNEELLDKNLEKEQKYSEEQIIKEEEN